MLKGIIFQAEGIANPKGLLAGINWLVLKVERSLCPVIVVRLGEGGRERRT